MVLSWLYSDRSWRLHTRARRVFEGETGPFQKEKDFSELHWCKKLYSHIQSIRKQLLAFWLILIQNVWKPHDEMVILVFVSCSIFFKLRPSFPIRRPTKLLWARIFRGTSSALQTETPKFCDHLHLRNRGIRTHHLTQDCNYWATRLVVLFQSVSCFDFYHIIFFINREISSKNNLI